MKRIWRNVIFYILLILVAGLAYIGTLAGIITGYAAKNLASGVFVQGRTQESVENEDLNFSFIRFTHNKVDIEAKKVTSRFLLWKSEALYNEGLGCTLVKEFSEKSVDALTLPEMARPEPEADSIPWPAGDKMADTLPTGFDTERLGRAVEKAFSDQPPYMGTFAVLVVYKDQIVAERYRDDFNPSTRFLSWSMAKSFTNAYVGLLVKEGKLDINKPVPRPEWQNDERRNITLNNLLRMESGLEWNESYGNRSDVTVMLHEYGDMGDYAAAKKRDTPPVEQWDYSSGTTNIVSDYVRTVMGNDRDYYTYPQEKLFHRIGMQSVIWEPDASGTLVGSSYLYATMRDYARFGMLYLHNGNWLGEEILTPEWVKYSVTPAPGSKGEYGAFFWLNPSGKYPGVPTDMFSCNGHNGQNIYIVPSKQLVVVRTGYSPKESFDRAAFLREVVECVR